MLSSDADGRIRKYQLQTATMYADAIKSNTQTRNGGGGGGVAAAV